MKKSHNELLQLSAQNNQNAFKELYDQTSPRLYRLSLHFLQNKRLAEEVLQETYLEIWRRCITYNPQYGSVIIWMSAIIRSKAIEKLCVIRKCVD